MKKTNNHLFAFIFLLVGFSLIVLESVAYPGFFSAKIGINLLSLVGITLLPVLVWRLTKGSSSFLFKANFAMLILSSLTYLVMYYFEKTLYENIIFSQLHIHPSVFAWLSPFFLITSLITLCQSVYKKVSRWLIFATPLLLALVGAVLRFSHKTLYFDLIREDSLIEYITVIASLVLVVSATKLLLLLRSGAIDRHGLYKVGLVISCLGAILVGIFIAGEEVSWGQRILGIATPEKLEQANLQGEINFHNLSPVFDYFDYISLYAGIYGAFSWIVFWLIKKFKVLNKKIVEVVQTWIPPWYTTFFFWLTPIYINLRFRYGIWAFGELGEPGEMYLMLGLAITWIRNYYQLSSSHET